MTYNSGRVAVDYQGPAFLRALAERTGVKYFDRVTELKLIGPIYRDDTVPTLAQLDTLDTLFLTSTRVSPAAVDRLRRALPDTAVIIDAPFQQVIALGDRGPNAGVSHPLLTPK